MCLYLFVFISVQFMKIFLFILMVTIALADIKGRWGASVNFTNKGFTRGHLDSHLSGSSQGSLSELLQLFQF